MYVAFYFKSWVDQPDTLGMNWRKRKKKKIMSYESLTYLSLVFKQRSVIESGNEVTSDVIYSVHTSPKKSGGLPTEKRALLLPFS